MYLRHLIHKRNHIAEELHETANAHVLGGTHAEHREHAAGGETATDAQTQFVFGQCLCLEELFHQAFVVFGSSLHQCAVHFHGLFHLFGWDVFDDGLTTFGLP